MIKRSLQIKEGILVDHLPQIVNGKEFWFKCNKRFTEVIDYEELFARDEAVLSEIKEYIEDNLKRFSTEYTSYLGEDDPWIRTLDSMLYEMMLLCKEGDMIFNVDMFTKLVVPVAKIKIYKKK